MWIFIWFFSTFFLTSCDACGQLNIRNEIAGRQVEGFIVKKYDKDHCNSNNVISYTVPEGGETITHLYGCQILYMTAKLKIPITPPITLLGQTSSLTLPGKEEQCRTYEKVSSPGCLYVRRNDTTNECVIMAEPCGRFWNKYLYNKVFKDDEFSHLPFVTFYLTIVGLFTSWTFWYLQWRLWRHLMSLQAELLLRGLSSGQFRSLEIYELR